MYKIEKKNIAECEKIYINNFLWEKNGYEPEVYAQIAYDDEGFLIKFTVFEENPKKEIKKHLGDVHLDSCIEWFVNFAPEIQDRYFNFEINAGGFMSVSFRTGRYDALPVSVDEINTFGITTEIHDSFWTGSYKIPFSFIKTRIPSFEIKSGMKIKTNLYKCGDLTEFVHYASHFDIPLETPEFHCPQYFGEMIVE